MQGWEKRLGKELSALNMKFKKLNTVSVIFEKCYNAKTPPIIDKNLTNLILLVIESWEINGHCYYHIPFMRNVKKEL